MADRREVLHDVMRDTGMTQSGLSRLSGVKQPSISGYLAGRIDLSDEQLDRLLACMGFRLEVLRRPVAPQLTRTEHRSWVLHRELSGLLDADHLSDWRPTIEANLDRLDERVSGEPHRENVRRWRQLLRERDLLGLHRVLTGLDRAAIEMREVSPMAGLLSDDQRRQALRLVG